MFLSATSLQQLLASVGDGVCMLDMEGVLIHWNSSAESLSGYQGNELLGRPCPPVLLQGLLGMERTVELSRLSGLLLQRQESRVVQGTLTHKKGHLLAVETTAFPLYDPLGLQLGACLLFRQKSQGYNKEQVVQLAKMAYFDSVSGTFSRPYGEMKLGAALAEMQQTTVPAGMLLVQLHNLKEVNDSLGHVAGDHLLQVVGKTVASLLEGTDIVVRWQSATFFILCYNGKKSLLLLLAERIRTLLAQIQPTFNGQELPLEVIVCGAVADVNDTTESLVSKAERVMLQTDTNRVLVADAK
nr:diguanylate cyclase [uncultured Anaeromusa sp.]